MLSYGCVLSQQHCGPPSSPYKVLRGGCWSSHRAKLRAAYRNYDLATDRHLEVGFRCVR
jgi:formylglycine-generating enzyme required for sulfatase activity